MSARPSAVVVGGLGAPIEIVAGGRCVETPTYFTLEREARIEPPRGSP
jgi:hypothetical protein